MLRSLDLLLHCPVAITESMELAVNEARRLPAHERKFVQLSRWNAADDTTFARFTGAGVQPEEGDAEIYYGFGEGVFDQLFPGKRTELLPVNNTSQVVVRSTPKISGPVRIYYTVFR
jgi:hypothetical protein